MNESNNLTSGKDSGTQNLMESREESPERISGFRSGLLVAIVLGAFDVIFGIVYEIVGVELNVLLLVGPELIFLSILSVVAFKKQMDLEDR